jgi:hypothetical protein
MGKTCITISIGASPQGPWQPIHNGELDNIGQYIWPVHAEAEPKYYFKVEARDWAGNVGEAVSNAVVIELNIPKVRIEGFDPPK